MRIRHMRDIYAAGGRTFTTFDDALLCSYALNAVFTIGSVDTLDTKSAWSSSGSEGELERDVALPDARRWHWAWRSCGSGGAHL